MNPIRQFNAFIIWSILLSYPSVALETDLEERTRLWMEANPHSLPHWLTPEELTRLDEIGRDFTPTDPPIGTVRNIAEFEPMEGVLIRYPLGISPAIIAEMSEDVIVTTIVNDQGEEDYVHDLYMANGVNLQNCNYLHAPTNSIWTRDYGPWFIVDDSNQVSVIDFPYNCPRPLDDEIPIEMAAFLQIPLYGMDIVHTGGNYMTEGMGISSSTTKVWYQNLDLTHEMINDMVDDYLGVTTYHVVNDPNGPSSIDHIDCWGKFLDVDKILIREVPVSHSQYTEIESTVDYFEAQTSAYGTPYKIFRVYTPTNEPYTNSLILNNKVLVPISNYSQWNDEAIASYETAMPGYEVLGFTGGWAPTDALHCRTKGIPDLGMLYIKHIPTQGNQPAGHDYSIQADIIPYSGEETINDSIYIAYRINGGIYHRNNMIRMNGNTWLGSIPGQVNGTEIGYYIHAADASGREANHPFIGGADPHIFKSLGLTPPNISIHRESDMIIITWDPIPEMDYYTVYSSVNPYDGFTVDSSGIYSGTTWSAPVPDVHHYYRVTSNTVSE